MLDSSDNATCVKISDPCNDIVHVSVRENMIHSLQLFVDQKHICMLWDTGASKELN